MDETISLDDLVKDIIEHLSETDEKYRAFVADKIDAIYEDDEDVLKGITEILQDPNTDGKFITDLASELLTPEYTYDGDSIVTVTREPGLFI